MEADVGTILSALTQASVASEGNGIDERSTNASRNGGIFSTFLDAGLQYTLGQLGSASVDIESQLDKWSTPEETENERRRLLAKLNASQDSAFVPEVSLEETVQAKANLTRGILQRFWTALENCRDMTSSLSHQTLLSMSDAKQLSAKASYYDAMLKKVKAESLDLLFKLRETHQEKFRLEKALEQALEKPLAADVTMSSVDSSVNTSNTQLSISVPNSSSSSDLSPVPPDPRTPGIQADRDITLILHKCSALERQIAASEAEVFRLERELNESLAADFLPESSREKYRQDVLSVVKILKDIIDTTVSTQRQTIKDLNDDCNSHKMAIEAIQSEARRQIQQSASLAEVEVKRSQAAYELLNKDFTGVQSKLLELNRFKDEVNLSVFSFVCFV